MPDFNTSFATPSGLQTVNETPILVASDFGVPSGGAITIGDGIYALKDAAIAMPDRLIIDPSATSVNFSGLSPAFASLSYTGTGIFITNLAPACIFEFENMGLVVTGIGAQMFDVDGIVAMTAFGCSFIGTNAVAGQTMGNVINLSRAVLLDAVTDAFLDQGWEFENNQNIILSDVGLGTGSAATNYTGVSIRGPNSQVKTNDVGLEAPLSTQNLFFIDPLIEGPIDISGSDQGAGNFFEALGQAGTIISFADASFTPFSINAVTDVGGVARFNFFPGPTVFVGMKVTITGFISNTTYNGTFIIDETDGTSFFKVLSIAFTGSEIVGDFESDSVTVGATAHGMSDDDDVNIIQSISYLGGFNIYNALTNSFQINSVFTAELIINQSFSSNSVDETDVRVNVRNSGQQKSSGLIGSVVVGGNTVDTVISTAGVFVDLNLNGGAEPGANMEGFTMMDQTTGEVRCDAPAPKSITLTGLIAAASQGGASRYEFQLLQNGTPLAAPETIVPVEIGADLVTFPVEYDVTGDTGDLYRIQVANQDNIQNIVIDTVKYALK